MTTGKGFDPILVAIVGKNIEQITKEMGISLVRSSSSPFFQAKDMCTAVLDEKGRILGQTEYLPLMAYTFPTMLRELLSFFRDEIYPGDVFIHNDVFYGCNQLQDLAFFKPVFYQDRLQFWTATKGHEVDLGGPVLGGYNPKATEVWEETLRIPPLKVYEKGKRRRDVWNLLMANNRLPDMVGRDFQAQIGGCTVGERRLLSLVQRYGLQGLKDHLELLLNSTERRMREEIRNIPNGIYESSTVIRGDGLNPEARYTARLQVTVKDDEITFDFTGSDAQSPGWINGVYATTLSASVSTFFMCVDPDIPHNQGALTPITVIVPEGTFLNARYPAATVRGNFTCNDAASETILKALSTALPQKVTAGWTRALGISVEGVNPRTDKVYYDVLFVMILGGAGSSQGMDGRSYIGMITAAGAMTVQDIELNEIQEPHFFEELEYWPDSGGAGQWRGGLGVHAKVRLLSRRPVAVTRGDSQVAAFGLFGGKDGVRNRFYYILPDGTLTELDPNSRYAMETDAVIEGYSGGGGGFGYPHLRDPEKVREDVVNQFVSLGSARDEYGVAIHPRTLEIDWAETEKLRDRKKKSKVRKEAMN